MVITCSAPDLLGGDIVIYTTIRKRSDLPKKCSYVCVSIAFNDHFFQNLLSLQLVLVPCGTCKILSVLHYSVVYII